MIRRHPVLSLLFSGLAMGSAISAQDSTVSEIEVSSINGGMTVLSEVVEEVVRTGEGTSRRTRQEFMTDANGRPRLVLTIEEDRVDRSDGGQRIIRALSELDVNGRPREIRREHEETVAEGGGIFRTEIEVSEPILSETRFLPTRRVEQTEQREGDVILELDRTTYATPTGGGTWEAIERRVLTRRVDGEGNRAVETVYRPNGAGDLVLNDRIESRVWTGSEGTEYRTEEVFTRDWTGTIPTQARAADPKLSQQVEIRRTIRPNGGWTTTRTVREPSGWQMRVVERVVERARPDGRGGTVIEREAQRLNVNGRFETTRVSQTRESGTAAR